jgi:hypothetical protein
MCLMYFRQRAIANDAINNLLLVDARPDTGALRCWSADTVRRNVRNRVEPKTSGIRYDLRAQHNRASYSIKSSQPNLRAS